MDLSGDVEQVISSLDGGVLTITMHRPEKKNALTTPMYTRMAELVERAGGSPSVSVILLCGGRDCFSSGNDVTTFGSMDEDQGAAPIRFLNAIAHCELPIVAAVNGPAVGVGTTMLLHCDFVVAGEEAVFRTPFVDLGVCPEAASSYLMPLQMGYLRAAQMLLLGEAVAADRAVEQGLASAVYPVASFMDEARALAARLAGRSPTSLRTTKKLMRAPMLAAIEAAMAHENSEFRACFEAPEFGETLGAYLEKRPADYSKYRG